MPEKHGEPVGARCRFPPCREPLQHPPPRMRDREEISDADQQVAQRGTNRAPV